MVCLGVLVPVFYERYTASATHICMLHLCVTGIDVLRSGGRCLLLVPPYGQVYKSHSTKHLTCWSSLGPNLRSLLEELVSNAQFQASQLVAVIRVYPAQERHTRSASTAPHPATPDTHKKATHRRAFLPLHPAPAAHAAARPSAACAAPREAATCLAPQAGRQDPLPPLPASTCLYLTCCNASSSLARATSALRQPAPRPRKTQAKEASGRGVMKGAVQRQRGHVAWASRW
jgi:hypothetical protein